MTYYPNLCVQHCEVKIFTKHRVQSSIALDFHTELLILLRFIVQNNRCTAHNIFYPFASHINIDEIFYRLLLFIIDAMCNGEMCIDNIQVCFIYYRYNLVTQRCYKMHTVRELGIDTLLM